jgi:hypothetical protein
MNPSRQAWKHQESPSALARRQLVFFAVLGVLGLALIGSAGALGGASAATAALVLVGAAGVLVVFVMMLGIVSFFDPQDVGEIVVQGPWIGDSVSRCSIDFTRPYDLAVQVSRRVVKTIRVDKHGGQQQESLVYDWAAYVLSQNGVTFCIYGKSVSASMPRLWRPGQELFADRTFGAPPQVMPKPPATKTIYVDGFVFDEIERALIQARNDGYRIGLTQGTMRP